MKCKIKCHKSMNRYDILQASDVMHNVFDIYIDTVDAWTAKEAITEFRDKYFGFMKYGVYGSRLHTDTQLFQAFPTRLDTDHPQRYIYLLEDAEPFDSDKYNLKERR